MNETLVLSDTAKLAKVKGFREVTSAFYNDNGILFTRVVQRDFNSIIWEDAKSYKEAVWYSAPTQSLLQKWLREKYNIHINVDYQEGLYYVIVHEDSHKHYIEIPKGFDTYEDGLGEGLPIGLNLINEKES